MKRLVIPKFDSEAEEAQWWHDNREAVGEDLIAAMKNGTAHRGGPAALLRDTRVLPVRMYTADIERVEKLAEEKGLSPQACLNMLIREALDREDARKRKSA